MFRRMQDIKDAEVDSVRDLTHFLDAELEYHERCAEELKRVRRSWAGAATAAANTGYSGGAGLERRPTGRSRSNTAHSYTERLALSRTSSNNANNSHIYEDQDTEFENVRPPIRSLSRMSTQGSVPPEMPARPVIGRANTFQAGAGPGSSRASSGATTPNYGQNTMPTNVGSLRGQLRPVSRITTSNSIRDDVFGDHTEEDTASGSGSPDWAERSASPATSYGSLSRTTSALTIGGTRKAPPPPPPSRSKKPPPPVPARRELGY